MEVNNKSSFISFLQQKSIAGLRKLGKISSNVGTRIQTQAQRAGTQLNKLMKNDRIKGFTFKSSLLKKKASQEETTDPATHFKSVISSLKKMQSVKENEIKDLKENVEYIKTTILLEKLKPDRKQEKIEDTAEQTKIREKIKRRDETIRDIDSRMRLLKNSNLNKEDLKKLQVDIDDLKALHREDAEELIRKIPAPQPSLKRAQEQEKTKTDVEGEKIKTNVPKKKVTFADSDQVRLIPKEAPDSREWISPDPQPDDDSRNVK